MGKYEDLKLLNELREKGSITEEEFRREKAKILNGTPPPPPYSSSLGIDDKAFVVIMHLSLLVSYIIVPLIMWLIGRERNTNIDQHGKNIINFAISFFIYGFVSVILIFVLIGIPLLILLGVLYPIFVIVAAVKAANGETWRYPLSIQFFN